MLMLYGLMQMRSGPAYCSNDDGDDCTTDQSKTRAAFERLFYEQGVDLTLWGHEHSYESDHAHSGSTRTPSTLTAICPCLSTVCLWGV